jgi:thiol-disulfide isomerase/thioredoxin
MRPPAGNAAGLARAESVVTAGLVACLAALAVATVVGLIWRASTGKMRPAGSGRSRRPAPSAASGQPAGASSAAGDARITTAQLGAPLGERATLLQFSSAFCAPCRATRRILADVADMTGGVAHIEIDAESRLDLVRALGVLRTPTVLVLAADGTIVRRASGQPRKADVIGALGDAVGNGIPYSSGLETG